MPPDEPPVVTTLLLDELLEQVDLELANIPADDSSIEAAAIEAAVAWLPALAVASLIWKRKNEKHRARVGASYPEHDAIETRLGELTPVGSPVLTCDRHNR